MGAMEDYVEAQEKYDQASDKLNNWSAILYETAKALSGQPGRFIFSNVGGGGLPMEASMSRNSVSVNANDFPTPEKIMATLKDYHAAVSTLNNAYHALPPAMKKNMGQPPKI